MLKHFPTYKLAMIATLLDEEEEEASRARTVRRHSKWVHKSLLKRETEGEFHTLYKELVDDEIKFYQYFRLSKLQFNHLLSKIAGSIKKKDTAFRKAISPIEKLAVCLRFLATGDAMVTIAFSYRLGHTTVWRIIKEVCNAIISKLLEEQMPFPGEEQWEKIANDFNNIWNFPNCVGALDGKHVQIQAPANSGSMYFNYKKTFSIVLLALVDAHYQFIAVDIGAYGKNSDGGIFNHSILGQRLLNGTSNLPGPKPLPGGTEALPPVIVADEAFPLKPFLLRPYPGPQIQQDEEKANFNYRLSRARRVVENAFGILTHRFRIYQRVLNSKPEYADTIILTTCILHNFIGDKSPARNSESQGQSSAETSSMLRNMRGQGGFADNRALEVREAYKNHFASAQGALPW